MSLISAGSISLDSTFNAQWAKLSYNELLHISTDFEYKCSVTVSKISK
jgi:hypothetical protein